MTGSRLSGCKKPGTNGARADTGSGLAGETRMDQEFPPPMSAISRGMPATSESTGKTPTAKVVVVDANAGRRALLANALIQAGYDVAFAPSGSFAVTMLEWERPDLVVSSAEIQDMDGSELVSLIRKDPTTMATPCLLLAGDDASISCASTEAGLDMVLTGDITPERVVGQVGQLFQRRSSSGDVRPTRRVNAAGEKVSAESLVAALEGAQPTWADRSADFVFQGSPSLMDLTDVIRSVAVSGETGCLIVSLISSDGVVLFQKGRVVHASFEGQTGETAFAALLLASRGKVEARFCFNRADHAALTHLPKTISRTVKQLLASTNFWRVQTASSR
jgi:CheY-like chemotaxis protein